MQTRVFVMRQKPTSTVDKAINTSPDEVITTKISEFDLPMSLRSAPGEAVYQQARIDGDMRPLHDEYVIQHFKHWFIIANRFPYDSCYKTSHMLLPNSQAPVYSKLTQNEKRELRLILDGYCQEHYHQAVENMAVRRSVMAIWHLHLVTFVDSRGEFRT